MGHRHVPICYTAPLCLLVSRQPPAAFAFVFDGKEKKNFLIEEFKSIEDLSGDSALSVLC